MPLLRRLLPGGVLAALILVAVATMPSLTHAQAEVPRFERIACAAFPLDVEMECGYLIVPEDRSQPDGPTIRLAVAIFKARLQDAAPDPVVYLAGGPGGSALQQAPLLIRSMNRLLRTRDVILFDQRGAGFSEPSLDCPEMDDSYYSLLDDDLDAAARAEQRAAAARQCRARLAGQGINLAAYTSAANAADVNDLRLALGYAEWNLFGVSYGTRLALTVLRDYPDGVRSVILDSVYPPQVSLPEDITTSAARAFDALFTGCASDLVCSRNYPNLEATFYALVDRLNETPIPLAVRDPLRGDGYTLILNGDQLVQHLFELLYQTDAIPLLPRALAALDAGDTRPFAALASQNLLGPQFASEGMYYSVECADEGPFSTAESIAAAAVGVDARLSRVFAAQAQESLAICADWGAAILTDIENAAVASDVPALVLSGQYDPITPPAWARQAAESLSRSTVYEFAGLGHGVAFAHLCPMSIVVAFVNDPTVAPTAACAARLNGPDFE